MNIRRLHYSNKPNVYPAYLIDFHLPNPSYDEWDFSLVESYSGVILDASELIQVLNPDLIGKMEARIKIARTKSSSGTVDLR